MSEVITAYKGFNADMTCRGFQFEVGKSYDNDGGVTVCKSGFHSCENPLDVLNYYDLCDSRFALVKASGRVSRQSEGDTNIASASLAVEVELKLPEFIDAAIKWMLARADSNLAASGYGSKLAASGNDSNLAASGNGSNLAASGDYSKLAASGDYSNLAASGYGSKLAASGDYSKLAASGDGSKLAASGYDSNLAASGYGSKAKAGANGAIALAYNDGSRARFAVGYVGEDGIKPDTWYCADPATGKLVGCAA